MKLQAITTCVDYADFLACSLLFNKPQFDRYIVVTTPEDRRTRDLCEHHYVECLVTSAFYDAGQAFAKSNAINAAIERLAPAGWLLHIDADIVLPPRARQILERLPLDPSCIYGVDRMMCPDHAAWLRYVTMPEVQHSCDTYVQATAFPLGVRVGHLDADGWAPIGFFQLWNPQGSGKTTYPSHGRADRSDLQFARLWPRDKRLLIPEIVAIHLEEKAVGLPMGVNWGGRKTPHFGPKPSRFPGVPGGLPSDYGAP